MQERGEDPVNIFYELLHITNILKALIHYYCQEMTLRGSCNTLNTLDEFLNILKPYSLTEEQHHVHCNSMKAAVQLFGGHRKYLEFTISHLFHLVIQVILCLKCQSFNFLFDPDGMN